MNKTRRLLIGLVAILIIGAFLQQSGETPTTQRAPGNNQTPIDNQRRSQVARGPQVGPEIIPSLSPTVRDLPPPDPNETRLEREVNPRFRFNPLFDPTFRSAGGPDPLLPRQDNASPDMAAPSLLASFDGNATGSEPHDPVGDVGPTYYIQATNSGGGTLVNIINKSTNTSVSTFTLDSLGSNECATGLGDPIILYDELAGRWFLSEFSQKADERLCIYISETSDPLGNYYHYNFLAANAFPDYPKYGVWPDAYYLGTNETATTVYALERADMLNGAPAATVSFNVADLAGFSFQMIPPADLDGITPPPSGAPGYFLRHRDDEVHNVGSNDPTEDYLDLYAFSVDWATPANSTFNQIASLATAEFDSDLCGLSSLNCFPQRDSSVTLDPLREVPMWRLQYRNFGSHETLVGNHVTDVTGGDQGGIRWYELRKVGGGSWNLYQEGTYSVGLLNRFMGSIAMDGSGNIGLAYSVTGSSVYPSIRFTGREAGDTLGTMAAEQTIYNGTGPTGNGLSDNRWGDYSSLNLDPYDDCTFWYTMEYGANGTRRTRIASFKFNSCVPRAPDFSGSSKSGPDEVFLGEPITYTITISNSGNLIGTGTMMTDTIPAGTTYINNSLTCDTGVCSYSGALDAILFTGDIDYGQETTVTFAVMPTSGNCTINNNATITAPEATAAVMLPHNTAVWDTVVFFTDLEADNGGFTPDPNGEWEWGTPSYPMGLTPFSGNNVWGTDLDNYAEDNIGQHILTGTFTLPPFNTAAIAWWDWYGDEIADERQLWLNGNMVWDDNGGTDQRFWQRQSVNLTQSYSGKTIEAAFILDVLLSNPGPDGWYVDDMAIYACGQPDAGIQLEKTVGLDPTSCGSDSYIDAVTGAEVVYCYTATNVGTSTLITHTLQDDQLGTIFTDMVISLAPANTAWVTETAVLNQTTVNQATWSASPTPTTVISHTALATVNIITPATYPTCADFESGTLPSYMYQETNSVGNANGRVQVTTSFPNNGSYALNLDTDCDNCGGLTQQAAIIAVDLSAASEPELNLWVYEHVDENHPEDGIFISDDGGKTWAQIMSLNGFPAQYTNVVIPLEIAATNVGMSLVDNFLIKVQSRDNYTTNSDGYSFDDICIQPGSPTVGVLPASLGSGQLVGSLVTRSLTISNSGTATLLWSLAEEPTATACTLPSDVPWLIPLSNNGSTSPINNNMVDIRFDATAVVSGTYTANLCLTSNDGHTPLVTIPVSMTACLAPTAVTNLSLTANGTATNLSWSDTGATHYEVWWADGTPYFTPGDDCAAAANCALANTNSYSHNGGSGNADLNYTYLILAIDACGPGFVSAPPSNRSAEFDYLLTPGA